MGGRKLPFHWILGNVTWCKRDEEIQENYKIFLPVKRTKSTKTIGAGFSFYKKEYEKDNAVEGNAYEKIDVPQVINADKIVYKVQIESRDRKLDNASQHYKGLDNIDYYQHNGQYKYTAGVFSTKKDADEYCKKVKAKGYSSAFVVSFKNGIRQ